MRENKIENFFKGIIDSIEAKAIPRGASSRSLNFVTRGDHIELRRGMARLNTTEDTSAGGITGGIVTERDDGTQIIFASHGKKVVYYNPTTEELEECGSDILGADADGEDVSFAEYKSDAGTQVFFSSPNSGLFKIMVANPTDVITLYDSTKNYKGKIAIKQNRMFLWGRVKDAAGLYLSHIDERARTTVTSENIGTGNAVLKTFAETLDFKAAGAKRSCFGIEVTDGTETFTDDYCGVLTGSLGGTGTINYATGAISVTFKTAPAGSQAITCTYQWEDPTNGGIADFTYSATRVAGEGDIIRQDDGGAMQNVLPIKDIEYCLHRRKTWTFQSTADDTNALNQIYRAKVGLPNWRAAAATGDGIYLIDDSDEKDPKLRLMTYDSAGSGEVIPVPISDNLDLADYLFDHAVVFEWGDYILIACRTTNSNYNNTVIVYDKVWKSFDKHDYWVNWFGIYGGTLIAGDSLSNNIYTLFSGFDDDDSLITGYWEGNEDNLDIENLKKVKRLVLQGAIQIDQSFKVSMSVDNSKYTEVGTVEGSGSYVDRGQSISVGATTVGSHEIGGGGSGVSAYNYVKEIKLRLDKFERIKIKFEPIGIGYMSISLMKYKDIRIKANKLPKRYRE